MVISKVDLRGIKKLGSHGGLGMAYSLPLESLPTLSHTYKSHFQKE